MGIVIFIFFVALIIPLLAKLKYGDKITSKELILATGISVLVSLGVYFAGSYSQLLDTEVLNAKVIKTHIVKQECQSGWSDYSDSFCTNEYTREVVDYYRDVSCTDSNGKSYVCGTEPVYKTQYSYEFDWEKKYFVVSPLSAFTIARVDRQGANIPPRWMGTKIGDPVSITNSYINYLRIADQNILNPANISASAESLLLVPSYPIGIYDYYKLNRVVTISHTLPNIKDWNTRLSEVNSIVGPIKKANVILVVTTESPDIRFSIEKKWLGGKKNDVIVILGVEGNTIVWSDAITFLSNRGNEFMTRELQDSFEKNPTLEVSSVLNIVEKTVIEKFDRLPMENISYLKDTSEPPLWVILTALITLCISSVAITFAAVKYNF
jgi:hypothetical protein